MSNVAFFTVGVLKAPYYEPQIAELGGLLDPVWSTAESSPGFIALSKQGERSVDGRAVKLDQETVKQIASTL